MQQEKEEEEWRKEEKEGKKGNENTVRLYWFRNGSLETAELELPEIKSRLARSCLYLDRLSQQFFEIQICIHGNYC